MSSAADQKLLGLTVRSNGQPATVSSSPDRMFLGAVAPEQSQLDRVVESRNNHIHKQAQAISSPPQRDEFLRKHELLTFDEFSAAMAKVGRWRHELQVTSTVKGVPLTPALRAFLQTRYDRERHPASRQGWVNYLIDTTPAIADRIEALQAKVELPEQVRQMHTLITAASGWGKTELLKSLIHHYVAHGSAAVVVLDPHGDMAPQVAQWPEFRDGDRLVYVEPGLVPGKTVGLNPLDASGLDADGIAVFADQLGTAIGELSSDLTGNMEMIARGCARLLLEDGKATLFDLLDLLENPPKKEPDEPTDTQKNRARLIRVGRQHPDRIMRRFFEGRLEADSLKGAREGIDNRLSRLLFLPRFQGMTCGRNTLPLQRLIEQRKVIICNLAPLGEAGAAAMGRLIVALVAGIGYRRNGTPIASRTPCHLFVDEAQTMASRTMADILFALRKFGIHLTLAQQVEGVNFDDVGQKALANSTQVRFVGANVKAALRPVFGDRDPPDEELKRHQFWTRWGADLPPMQLRVRSEFAGVGREAPTYRMTEAEWEAVKARQLATYYRDEKEAPQAPQAAPGGDPAASPDPAPPKRPRRPL